MISFQCECGKVVRAADEHAGKRGRCSACGKVMVVPGGRPVAVSPSAASAPAARPAAASARKPAPPAAAPASPPKARPRPVIDDDDESDSSPLYDLDEPVAPVRRGRPCPNCTKPLPSPDATFCVECGYNLSTGKKTALEVAKPKKARKKRSSPGVGDFFMRRLGSRKFLGGMASLIGGTVWLVLGLMANRLFFYPVFLIIAGIISALAGLIGGDD